MRSDTVIEMTEEEHGLIGCGKITFTYSREPSGNKGHYHFVDKDYRIDIPPENAREIFDKLEVEDTVDINTILRIATDSCGIHLFRIKEKTNKAEVVFARYLAFWYMNKHMECTFTKVSEIFNKTHATVIYGVRIIDDDPKYLKEDQRLWRKIFMNKLKEKKLI